MRNYTLLALVILGCLTSCRKNELGPDGHKNTVTLQGTISTNTTLDANNDYLLTGQVYVKNNVTLTIPAGTTIKVQKNDGADNKSSLIITQGSKLVVNGTAQSPVVFTSAAANKAPGDWGAIVILGKAPTNVVTGHAMGLPSTDDTKYGGTVANDNSGVINYLRVEYAGGLNAAKEDEWIVDKVAGLSLHSVGSGTVIDNVMVSHSADDGFQFVGGTVNATHLIGFNNGDDDFDFDLGYQGYLQFLIGYRTQAQSLADRANGFESYNDEVPTTNAPLTRPVVSNMTIIGPQGVESTKTNINQGVYMRKGTRLAIRNSLVAEYSQGAFMTCPRTRPVILANDNAEFRSNLVQSDIAERTFSYDNATTIVPDPDMAVFLTNTVNKNTRLNAAADFKFTGMYTAVPDLTPATGSPALTGADFTGTDFSAAFFVKTTYRGAIGTSNWAAASAWAVWN
jgi:hypothetical protein